jgi:hypothetical protein
LLLGSILLQRLNVNACKDCKSHDQAANMTRITPTIRANFAGPYASWLHLIAIFQPSACTNADIDPP